MDADDARATVRDIIGQQDRIIEAFDAGWLAVGQLIDDPNIDHDELKRRFNELDVAIDRVLDDVVAEQQRMR